MWQRRLFHLVIQLFSHLVDVPASSSGAQTCTQKGKAMDPRKLREAADWKNHRLWRVQMGCASSNATVDQFRS